MKNLKFTMYIALIGSMLLMLTSCISPPFNPVENDRNFSFNAGEQKGLVAFSVQCSGYYAAPLDIYFYNLSSDFMTSMMFPGYKPITISCINNLSQFIMLKLNAGDYKISGISSFYATSTGFKPLKFKVYPGKVNYIGYLQMKFTPTPKSKSKTKTKTKTKSNSLEKELGKIRYALFNFAERDIPIFLAKYPKIPRNKYVTHLATVK